MAGLIERRTSQPYDVILAMLTRETDHLAEPAAGSFDSGDPGAGRRALRVVRADSGVRAKVQDRQPA